jgi:hypothetical protein
VNTDPGDLYTMSEKLASLIDPFISFEENEVLEKGHIKNVLSDDLFLFVGSF